ncbi:Processing alpha glucosidase I [Ascosphaera pollenicola]|nr:Processing alpha glucosidase I [Ascosphaera pollenicola]
MVPQSTKIDIIGVAEGCIGTVDYLGENWSKWEHRISAICMADPPTYMTYNCTPEVLEFLGKRSRAYMMSEQPTDTHLSDYVDLGVNCYSSGVNDFSECIVPNCYKSMLKWLDIMYANPSLEEKPLVAGGVEVLTEGARFEELSDEENV